jgi:Protein of unknown function (DUF2971)
VSSGILAEADARFTTTITDALQRAPFPGLNEPVFHFTDATGLYGILRTKSLWATLATALEDTSEIAFALSRARHILQSRDVERTSPFLEQVVELLDLDRSQTIAILGMKTYIVSLRTRSDASAHWEKYGRDGTGFALAFALTPLVLPGVLALPVIYDESQQDKLLRGFIESNVRALEEIQPRCPLQDMRALRARAIQMTALGLWILSPLVKHPDFGHEREWRLIITDVEKVEVAYPRGMSREVRSRWSNGREIPYKVLQYDALPVVGLELGPFVPFEEHDARLRRLLRQATGGREVPITRSHVPVGQRAV